MILGGLTSDVREDEAGARPVEHNELDVVVGLADDQLAVAVGSGLDVAAQVDIESKVRKRYIMIELQALRPIAGNPGSTRVDLVSTWCQPGVNPGSTRGQNGVNPGSTWGEPGVNLGLSWGQAAAPYLDGGGRGGQRHQGVGALVHHGGVVRGQQHEDDRSVGSQDTFDSKV